jgi:predicted NAD/FAD-dependent oxidoreductase
VARIDPPTRREAEVHRWRFSEPITTHRAASIWLPDLGVGFAGDAFGGPRVEGAAVSGLDLADRIAGPAAVPDATDHTG